MTVAFKTLRRDAVADQAIETIKEMIVRGDVRAGQRLPPERELAAQLGVSRPSLREAIRALIALNILDSRHGEGTFISSLEPDLLIKPIDFVLQVNDGGMTALFEARRELEAGIAALAAERATDLELAELDDLVAEGRAKVSDPDAFIDYDVEFHDRVRRFARSPVLASMLGSVSLLSLESRRRTAQVAAVRSRAASDHALMVKKLKARDSEGARQTMLSHLHHVLEGLPGGAGQRAR